MRTIALKNYFIPLDSEVRWKIGEVLPSTKEKVNSDIKKYENYYELKIDVPGFGRKDLRLTLSDKRIWLQGRSSERKGWWPFGKAKETTLRTINTSFRMPADVHMGAITAECRNGLLSVHMPRLSNSSSRRRIEIENASRIRDPKVLLEKWSGKFKAFWRKKWRS